MVQRTKIPRSHEIKSLDFRPKRFDVRQASMMVHVGDVYTTSLSGDLCTIKKYMRALTREKNSVDETAHGRGYSLVYTPCKNAMDALVVTQSTPVLPSNPLHSPLIPLYSPVNPCNPLHSPLIPLYSPVNPCIPLYSPVYPCIPL